MSQVTPQLQRRNIRESTELTSLHIVELNCTMNGLISLPSEDQVSFLANECKDYCLTHGLVMRAKDSYFMVEHAPFTLLPTAFPKRLFSEAKEVQKDFNLLVHTVSQNHEFLKEALQR